MTKTMQRKALKTAGWTVTATTRVPSDITAKWHAVASRHAPRVIVVSASGETEAECIRNLADECAKAVA